jgi:NDP-sugar pyrophosphorylase family protein
MTCHPCYPREGFWANRGYEGRHSCWGLGSRISEESHLKPKPMIEIGGRPILWHVMKIYSHHGINDFIICCGYKGYVIKEYFAITSFTCPT